MTPIEATLTGSIGVKAGLGRDTLTINFDETVPADAKMVAIKGDNGVGKSTFFNLAMTPWLKPPMLTGTLYDEFLPGKGIRQLYWTHGGMEYHSRIMINQSGETRTTRAHLKVLGEDGKWGPYRRNDGLASDGKGKVYTELLEDILGPQSIYYLSAFRAQGAPKLAEYSKPKELMRDLLSLDEPHNLALKAGKVYRSIEQSIKGFEERVKEVDGGRQRLLELSLDIDENRKVIAINLEKRGLAEEKQIMARAAHDTVVKENFEEAKLRQAITDMERRIAEETARGIAEVDVAQGQVAMAQQLTKEEEERFVLDNKKAKAEIDRLTAQAYGLEALLGQEEKIQQAASELSVLEINLSAGMEERAKLGAEYAGLSKDQLAIVQAKNSLAKLVAKGKTMADQCQALTDLSGYIATVPCQGAGKYASCPALVDARAAQVALPDIMERREELRAKYKADADDLGKMGAPEKGLVVNHEMTVAVDRAIKEDNSRIATLRPLAAKGAMLDDARRRLTSTMDRIESAAAGQVELVNTHATNKTKLKEDALCATKAKAEAVADAKVRLEKLTTDLESLPKPGADQSLESSAALARANSVVSAMVAEHEGSIAYNEQMKAERVALEKMLVRNKDMIDKHESLKEEYGAWGLLEKSLYGAIDLSIEAAGPAIAAASNALLRATYGPRFTIKIVTQRQNLSNPSIREVFSINVIDGDTGLEHDVLKKSGGEGVWVGKALTDGVGIHFQQSAGVQYETGFGDEVDDGLTRERKKTFYQMDRAAVDAGGYSRKYFISHDENAWEVADYVIDFDRYRA